MPRIESAAAYSRLVPVEADAFVLVARAAHVRELYPSGAGRIPLVLRITLHDDQRARGGLVPVERLRVDVRMVAERGALRIAETGSPDALRAGRDLRLDLRRYAAIA